MSVNSSAVHDERDGNEKFFFFFFFQREDYKSTCSLCESVGHSIKAHGRHSPSRLPPKDDDTIKVSSC